MKRYGSENLLIKITLSFQLIASSGSNLLSSELQFLEVNCNSVTTEDKQAFISETSEDKQTFISEDGKVCFITGFDENSFLTMS